MHPLRRVTDRQPARAPAMALPACCPARAAAAGAGGRDRRRDGGAGRGRRRPGGARAGEGRGGTGKCVGWSVNGPRPFEGACDAGGHTHELALEPREFSASFGGIRAVNDVSITAHQGQIVGMIGPNGAGKTTILHLLSGFVTPS